MKKLIIGYIVTFAVIFIVYPYFTDRPYNFENLILASITALGTPIAWILIKEKK